jgi:hypothetical protein
LCLFSLGALVELYADLNLRPGRNAFIVQKQDEYPVMRYYERINAVCEVFRKKYDIMVS